MKVVVGLAIVVAHVAGFVALARHCQGTELTVDVPAPLAAPTVTLEGRVPPALAPRVTSELAQQAPGLARRTWSVRYRGGYVRSIGAAQLVGPFQDPTAHACSGRVVVGQRLLDDGKLGADTIAGQMKRTLEAELAGEGAWAIGDFVRVKQLSLRWAELAQHPEDASLVKAAPHGYVRVTATLAFERVDVPLVLALVPEITPAEVRFVIRARAQLDFGNRVVQWLSDRLGGDRLATRLTRRQIDASLVTALTPPSPFELPGGSTITFRYCTGVPQIVEGAYGALPFGIAIGRVERDPALLPPRRGPAPQAAITADTRLAIDLDLDALNALLFELWRSGLLDARLTEAGLDRRFNTDPTVTELLSVRISAPRLALPPVLSPHGAGLRLSADARVAIADGATHTIGRVWGGLDFTFAAAALAPVSVDLGALELSCERTPTLLVPCYADLVAAIGGRGADFHGELTQTFTGLLADIFVDRRLSDSGLPADLVIRRAAPSLTATADNASLHLALDATLVTRR
jgi:hypothetical protein